MKAVTTQKVHAVMRKANIPRSKWHKSQRVKGWGVHSTGYTTFHNEEDLIEIGWNTENGWNSSEIALTKTLEALARVRDALAGSGIKTRLTSVPSVEVTGYALEKRS